jgi:hypothetical protein
MLFRQDHHACRVAQVMFVLARILQFADTVLNDQPAVPSQDWRSATADFETLPR